MPFTKRKIMVAMSGGVDSSVVAALLREQGHEVSGAFMKNWSDDADPCTGECTWKKERQDALRVAATLGIPFETFDFEEQYRREVIEYMVAEYSAGRTPNPDVLCNSKVKFHLFLDRARATGAEYIATGHYARVIHAGETRPDGTVAETHELYAGVDTNKDQSYFLHRLSQAQLKYALFPVGDLPKPEVRRLAAQHALPTAEKKDSQGICFVGQVDLKEFLGNKIVSRPGDIITVGGEVIGRHDGVAPFTIGQRHGLGIGGGEPWFVVAKDMEANTVTVAHGDDRAALYAPALEADQAHWISGQPPAAEFRVRVRIRYRQPLQNATVTVSAGDTVRVAFDEPQRAITPGQFAVFYGETSDICLGGAVITKAVR